MAANLQGQRHTRPAAPFLLDTTFMNNTLSESNNMNNYCAGLYNNYQQEGFNSIQMAANLQDQSHTRPATHNADTTFMNTNNINTLSEYNNMNNDCAGLYNNVYQQEGFNSIQMAANLQDQRHTRPAAPFLHNADMNTIHYGNTRNRTTSYSPISYYDGVDVSMNELLNPPNFNQVATHENSSCPVCGFSNGHFDNINRSITHTVAQNFNAMNEHVVIREVRIQFALGTVPATASFDKVLALIRK
ncbi:7377_t:CDS:1 [Paraglomus brasilianum]|uniref:7377_t:CDS:1 n=1 Tax=Paraglomus brasilianum TaxID=144538 RepID=A0A9N9GEE8_9GLOM|nr:7377_t:CDS:1 [Paraglomus brasilianum]